ncbi:MAG: GNAT family N-acetyltransferase [Sphingomonadales bacterium]|nr:GNAT family N-acetyltransferase [Sphingomonadales bacterium]
MIAPTLTTQRMTLTALTVDHWEANAEMWADPRTTEFIGGKPRPRNESWIRFAAGAGLWSLIGYGYWAFLDRDTGSLLGIGGLSQWERGIAELEGYPETGWAFTPDAWGRGYATEAMIAVLDWADHVARIPETRCIIDPGNAASHRVAAKLGYVQFAHSEGAIGPVHVYARKFGDKAGD